MGKTNLVHMKLEITWPGQIALLSISSQRREKKPVTQVPLHRPSGDKLAFSLSSPMKVKSMLKTGISSEVAFSLSPLRM